MADLSSSFQRLAEIRAHQPVNPEVPGPVLLGSGGEDEKDRRLTALYYLHGYTLSCEPFAEITGVDVGGTVLYMLDLFKVPFSLYISIKL